MAIQVNGTTVIDNSRNLENIASIDATTEAAITSAGFTKTTGDITNVSTGGGLTGGGSSGSVTVSHADTSAQGSVNNSGNTVIQDITLDTYGHITGINSTTISSDPPTALDAVGTYVMGQNKSGVTKNPGDTIAGSQIYYGDTSGFVVTSPRPSGTYRVMGYVNNNGITTYVRVS